jgi:glycosyltransferase involved in cell wall biosynthesis
MKKTALVHDWLFQVAGAEKVLEAIYGLFPGDIFTLFKGQSSFLEGAHITPSFLNSVPFSKKIYRHLLPFYPAAIESFNLSEYDLILSSSHAVANKVLCHSDQLHISYCHSPMRYIWDLCFDYFGERRFSPKNLYIQHVLHRLRTWDAASHPRVDHFIANSAYIQKRIYKIYRRESEVIYPPVDVERFSFCKEKEDYYLTVSRLVSYKRVDVIIDAFNQMPNKKLIVVGGGPLLEEYKKRAKSNVEILGHCSDEIVEKLMARAKGFVFAAIEDFGISPIEAMATGTPVIALNKGGTKETVIDKKTGLLFESQSAKDIIGAVYFFDGKTFDPFLICEHAKRFSKERFHHEYQNFIEQKWEEHRKKLS